MNCTPLTSLCLCLLESDRFLILIAKTYPLLVGVILRSPSMADDEETVAKRAQLSTLGNGFLAEFP